MTCFFILVGTLKLTFGLNHDMPQFRWASTMTAVAISRTGFTSDSKSATKRERKSCLRHEDVLKLLSPPPTTKASMLTSYSSVGRTVEPPSRKSTRGTWLREKSTSRLPRTVSSSCSVRWHWCRFWLPEVLVGFLTLVSSGFIKKTGEWRSNIANKTSNRFGDKLDF